MNARAWFRNSAAVMLLLVAQGCNDFGITTVVSSNGSIDRLIVFKTPAKNLPDVAFPLPADSTWRTTWQPASHKDSNSVFTASKHFDTFEALTSECARITDTNKIRIVVDVQKRFRWFYTYYDYVETYKVFNPLLQIPPRDFFTPDEIRRIMADEKSDTLDARRKEWDNRNGFELVFRRLVATAARMNDPALPASLLESNKEVLFRALTDESNYKGLKEENQMVERAAGIAVRVMGGVLKTKFVANLGPTMVDGVREMFHRDEIRSKGDGSYTNTVIMPGVILETNAKEVSGSRVVWKFSEKQLSILDVEMRVQSRVVNTWAVVVSAVAALGLLLLPVVLQLRRRRR